MKENTQDKSLVQINENGIFYKIKKFFKNLFNRNVDTTNNYAIVKAHENLVESENKKKSFMESINNFEETTKLLKLQKQYRSGEIKEEELTQEQVDSLCALYDKQIENLRKSNQIRKQKLLEYRRKLKNDN